MLKILLPKYYWIFILCSLISCRSIKELKSFSKCQFRLNEITDINVSGVNIQSKKNIKELQITDAFKITQAIASGKIPLNFTVNVDAKNPNEKLAAINGFDWIAYIDDNEILTGNVNQRFEVAPQNQTVIPVFVSVDLVKVLNSKAKDAILNLIFNLANEGKNPSHISLKIKPEINIGSLNFKYPDYFKVTKEFSSQ